MSLDDEVRSYERTLLRSGQDPRAVAAKLLGVDPERFWLLVDAWGEDEPAWVVSSEAQAKAIRERRKATVFTNGADGSEFWEAVFAFRPVSLAELVEWSAPFMARNMTVRIWDNAEKKQVTFYGAATVDRVEEGWREPRDGPGRNRFGVTGGNTLTAPTLRIRQEPFGPSVSEAMRQAVERSFQPIIDRIAEQTRQRTDSILNDEGAARHYPPPSPDA